MKSRQTVLVTELKVGLCHICFQGKWQKFSEANTSRHLKYLLGDSQKGQLLILLDTTCSVCTSHSLFVLGGVGSISFLHSFVPRVPTSVVLHKVLGERHSHCSQEAHKEVPNF